MGLGAALLALMGASAGIALAAPAAAITATEGQQFSGVVDTVSCMSQGRVTNVSIDWGDQTTQTIAYPTNSNYGAITPNHTYAAGEFPVLCLSRIGHDKGIAEIAMAGKSSRIKGSVKGAVAIEEINISGRVHSRPRAAHPDSALGAVRCEV